MRKKQYIIGAAAIVCIFTMFIALRRDGGITIPALAESNAVHTLVIDAGHGGFDGGAVGASGTSEQDINLAISQRVQALAGFFGVRTVMTRPDNNALVYDPSRPIRENKAADIKERVTRTQAVENPIFMSIHLNKFSDPQYHGAQVFYSPNHAGSRVLAESLQDCLIRGCDPSNHRQAKQAERTIYLMKTLQCPAVIIECGFLSNPNEEKLLQEKTYQTQVALCIICGYLSYENVKL